MTSVRLACFPACDDVTPLGKEHERRRFADTRCRIEATVRQRAADRAWIRREAFVIRTGIVALALCCVLASCGGGGGGGTGGSGNNPAPAANQFYPGTTPIPTSGPDVSGVAAID